MPAPCVYSKLKCLKDTILYLKKINKPIKKHKNQPRDLINTEKKKRRENILCTLNNILNTVNEALYIQENNQDYINQLCEENKFLLQTIEDLLNSNNT